MRRGFSLLELLVTTTLMTALVTTVVLLLRTSQVTWEAYESDASRMEVAHAVVRHLVRQLRQSEGITAISADTNYAGSLTALMPDGLTHTWSLSGSEVTLNNGSGAQLLADGIATLNFVGYQADAVTATSVPGEIQSVKCTVGITLDRDTNNTRAVSSRVWLRGW